MKQTDESQPAVSIPTLVMAFVLGACTRTQAPAQDVGKRSRASEKKRNGSRPKPRRFNPEWRLR
jgi:hypothetical protein